MPFARASELDRLLLCAGSTWLTRVDTRPAYVKKMAEWGTQAHHWKATGEIPNTAPGRLLKRRVEASGIKRDELWPEKDRHEVGMAYNVVTQESRMEYGRDLVFLDNWKAGFDDRWVTGTTDYAGDLLGTPWIDDLKTGNQADLDKFRAQLTFYSLVLSTFEYKGPKECRVTVTHWPKYPVTGLPRRFGGVIGSDELSKFQTALSALRDLILLARTSQDDSKERLLVPGEQCTYCPSKSVCGKAYSRAT